jgi:hypothetical protein
MDYDIILPITLSILIVMITFMHSRLEKYIRSTLGKQTNIGKYEAVLMVFTMGIMITLMAILPSLVVQIIYIISFSYMLFTFTYIVLKKLYYAILLPVTFFLIYLFNWNLLASNLFAIVLVSFMTIYLATLFSWKVTWIFTILLTIMDSIQVFITGFMGKLAEKAVFELGLPVVLQLPTYPAQGIMILGLGDIFLSCLLSIQVTLKQGSKNAIVTAITIGFAFFILEVLYLNKILQGYFPATVIVILGLLLGLGIIHFGSIFNKMYAIKLAKK